MICAEMKELYCNIDFTILTSILKIKLCTILYSFYLVRRNMLIKMLCIKYIYYTWVTENNFCEWKLQKWELLQHKRALGTDSLTNVHVVGDRILRALVAAAATGVTIIVGMRNFISAFISTSSCFFLFLFAIIFLQSIIFIQNQLHFEFLWCTVDCNYWFVVFYFLCKVFLCFWG